MAAGKKVRAQWCSTWLGMLSFLIGVLWLFPMTLQAGSLTDGPAQECVQELNILKAHKKEVSRELRHIKRELGALHEAMNEPGINEILGGIGYIFGVFGVSYYWHARNLIKNKG